MCSMYIVSKSFFYESYFSDILFVKIDILITKNIFL